MIAQDSFFPKIGELLSMLGTYILIAYSWIYFRSDSLTNAIDYTKRIFTFSSLKESLVFFHNKMYWDWGYYVFVLTLLFIIIEWFGRKNEYAIEKMFKNYHQIFRWCFYSFLIFLIGMYMQTNETPFIYFQF